VPLVLYGGRNIRAARRSIQKGLPHCPPGNFGRNVPRGFGTWQADVAFQRQVHVTNIVGTSFRGESSTSSTTRCPDNNLTDALFGQSTQTIASLTSTDNAGFNPRNQIGGPRSIQQALRLQF
jgi:hypothetical protein